MTKFRTTE